MVRVAQLPAPLARLTVRLRALATGFGPRRAYARNASRLGLAHAEPALTNVVSQLATGGQIASPTYEAWRKALALPPIRHRKYWEYAWIVQALEESQMLRPGRRGVGFGVGSEPLAALMAKRGCTLVATDAPSGQVPSWVTSGQHAADLEAVNPGGLCPPAVFRASVRFRQADVNDIPGDLRGFDFCWSACALEHLGSLEMGLRFIERSLDCLRPGGIAVHTTEFNLSSAERTIESGSTVLYRQRDVEALVQRLRAQGHRIDLNLHPGGHPLDRYVDLPPYRLDPHVKLLCGRYVSTSIGLLIRRA